MHIRNTILFLIGLLVSLHQAFAFELLPSPTVATIDTSSYFLIDGAERLMIPLSCPNYLGGDVSYIVFYAQSISGTSTQEVYLNGVEATGYQVNANATSSSSYSVGSGQENRVIASWSSPIYCNARTANFLWIETSGTNAKLYMNADGRNLASMYPSVIDKSTHSSFIPSASTKSLFFGVFGSEATTSSSGGGGTTTTITLTDPNIGGIFGVGVILLMLMIAKFWMELFSQMTTRRL